jgi:hypothetical protein
MIIEADSFSGRKGHPRLSLSVGGNEAENPAVDMMPTVKPKVS